MTNRTHTGLFVLVLAAGLAGCDGNSPSPTGPSPVSQQTVPPPAAPNPPWVYGGGHTLHGVGIFGVVSETTPTGQIPIADVSVYCDACGAFGHTSARTDANGYYSFDGDLDSGGGIWLNSFRVVLLLVGKEGYQDPPGLPTGRREVPIDGDTRVDIELVRQ